MPSTLSLIVESTQGKDRRRSLRTPHIAEAWVWSPTSSRDDEQLDVTSLNVSKHGVAFTLDKPIPVHCFHMIEIRMGQQHLKTEVRIISCRQNEEGKWEVGAEFC